jgi:hypothetical protein
VGASVSTVVKVAMARPVSMEMRVTASTTAPTIIAAVTRSEMVTFVPPFMAGVTVSTSVPTSPHPQVRPRLDDWFITMQSLSREQPCGMPTLMIANLHNNVSAPLDHVNPFTPFITHSPSSSGVYGISSLPTLTT